LTTIHENVHNTDAGVPLRGRLPAARL